MDFDRRKQPFRAWNACLVLSTLAIALAAPPRAGGTTGTLAITATVNANCTISTSVLNFGRYESLLSNATSPLNAAGSVSIACTRGSAPSITIDLGRNANSGRRYMALATGSSGADALNYEIYQPPNPTPGTACSFPGIMPWGPTGAQAFTPSPSSSRDARTYSVCGTIPPGQGVSMGSYADTVVATVNF
jgi:spore coat protein U-like protein